jgi:platelet-activating factor acetylhydrolase IB subunit beta/gamma
MQIAKFWSCLSFQIERHFIPSQRQNISVGTKVLHTVWQLVLVALQSSIGLLGAAAISSISLAATCSIPETSVSASPVIEQSSVRLAKADGLAVARGNPDVVIIGDSLAANWGKTQARDFPGLSVTNLGIGGERTQELRWRIAERLPKITPERIILITGTNNIFDQVSHCELSAAIKLVQRDLERAWPTAKLFVIPIMPRGDSFRFRENDRKLVNNALSNPASETQLIRVDEASLTCNWASGPCVNYNPDKVHFSGTGYAVLRQALRDAGFDK